eukprot:30622-Eustigmatos_ZCMA.PRE.1
MGSRIAESTGATASSSVSFDTNPASACCTSYGVTSPVIFTGTRSGRNSMPAMSCAPHEFRVAFS